MNHRPIRVVIPMKPVPQCKSRLARVLSPPRRASLVLWMLRRVALAAIGSGAVAEVAVLGGDEPIRELCRTLGATWQADPAAELNTALDSFYRATCGLGWPALLFLAGDLPLIAADDIDGISQSLEGADLVLSPAERGGTNAILSRCGVPFQFQLGAASFRRHRDRAKQHGIATCTYTSARMHADVDTPGDLARLLGAEPDLWQQVAEVERFLREVAT